MYTYKISSHFDSVVIDRVKGLLPNGSLLLGVFTLVRQEIGFDVRVRVAIAISSCKTLGSVDMHHQCAMAIEQSTLDFTCDVIVTFAPCCTVDAGHAAKAGFATFRTQL